MSSARLHGCDRRDHRLDALLHGGKPAWCGQRYLCRACRPDILRGRDRCIGEFVERGALRLGGLDQPAESGRSAGRRYRGCPRRTIAPAGRARHLACRCAARRQIACKVVIVIGREQAGIDVVVAVAPERGAGACCPTAHSHRCRNRRTARTAARPSRIRHCRAATIRRRTRPKCHPASAAPAVILARAPGSCSAPL